MGLFIFLAGCADYQKALVLDKHSRSFEVELLEVPCLDYYQKEPAVVKTRDAFIPLEQISAIEAGGAFYQVVSCEETIWQHECKGKPVILKILVQGRLRLAESCFVRWMNTMLSKESVNLLRYAYQGEGNPQWQNIEQDPKLFMEQSKTIFAGQQELLTRVENTGYKHPVPDAKPGYVSEYEMVTRENLEDFFKTYNGLIDKRD